MNAHFLIAKYAPDLKRMEPRNVGIIAWADGLTASKFLGDSEGGKKRSLPRRVGVVDAQNYYEWVASWRKELSRNALELSHGKFIDRSSPEFIEGLREWSAGNYMLVNGGVVNVEGKATPRKLKEATEYLFKEVVMQPEDAAGVEQESVALKSKVNDLWKSTGVWERPDFRRDQPVHYKLYGESKAFIFDYAIGPSDAPYSVYHRIVLGQQRAFDSAFLNLEHYRQSRKLEQNRCTALVTAPGGDSSKRSNYRLLRHIANVIDVTNEGQARNALLDAVSLNGKP